jgi:protein-S-isoprenylcysteine O-methyltransferase Ste14
VGVEVVSLAAPTMAHRVTFYTLIACWWIFGLTFWLRKRPPKATESKRDRSSLVGLALQAAAYFLIWIFPLRSKQFSILTSGSETGQMILGAITIALAVGSVWLVNAAARRLGKQWALTARVLEGHNLIQDGPYGFVRNPIYTGMFGLLLATGLAVGRGTALVGASVLFLAGTWIRIRSEEQLLRQAFGAEFEAYERKVPALIPGVY